MAKRRAKTGGMRNRWMRTSMLAVGLVLLLVFVLFSVLVASYYYTTVRTGLETKAQTSTDFFTNYINKTYAEFYDSAYRYTESFEDADKLELQFIDTDGRIVISSNGITAGTNPGTSDIGDAIQTGETATFVGRSNANERVMAVSAPIMYSGDRVIGVMRYVTSLRLVNRQLLISILAAAAACMFVMLIVVLINMIFIRSVILPVNEITTVSKRIAEGSYGIQIEKTYGEEIGEMVSSINEMSLKIAQSERMQTEFISSVSHELRTPLTAITGWGETLLYNTELDMETRKGVAIMLKESKRLSKMVEELLEFTRIEDGRFTLNVEQTDIAAELEDAIFAYRELLSQEQMEIVYEPPEKDIPMIPADPARLRQVFLNVFDNAAKYAKSGGSIDVSIDSDGNYVTIKIRDHGPGLPEDELENVKMKFYKGSNAKERGSGIGLAVCDEIIKYHGGTLKLSNAEGGGLLITIRLPESSMTQSQSDSE
ncbi:MAG: sensor histidine kinase [Oscillospiraceae bacterium]|nr:sensor histidine kinase [Oscillospiraceae bacterium]